MYLVHEGRCGRQVGSCSEGSDPPSAGSAQSDSPDAEPIPARKDKACHSLAGS